MLLLVTLFFVGSVGCGIATTMNQIIFSRVIAGFGGGGLQLMSNVVIQDLVPPHKRGQYQSYVSSVQTVKKERRRKKTFTLFSPSVSVLYINKIVNEYMTNIWMVNYPIYIYIYLSFFLYI